VESTELKWAYDLASMLQVSLVAYAIAGLATTQSYFDLVYQLMAMCSILQLIIAGKKESSSIIENIAPSKHVNSVSSEPI